MSQPLTDNALPPEAVAHLNMMKIVYIPECEPSFHRRIAEVAVHRAMQCRQDCDYVGLLKRDEDVREITDSLAMHLFNYLQPGILDCVGLAGVPAIPFQSRSGMLIQDYLAAELFERISGRDGENSYGREFAKKLRERAREKWKKYREDTDAPGARAELWAFWLLNKNEVDTLFVGRLADVILNTVIGPKWYDRKTNHPSLTKGVSESLMKVYKGKVSVGAEPTLSFTGDKYISAPTGDDFKQISITGIDVAHAFGKYRDGEFSKLSSKLSLELLFFEVKQAWHMWIEGKYDYKHNRPVIKLPGGYKELAALLGVQNNLRCYSDLRDILIMQAHLTFHVGNYHGPLISLAYDTRKNEDGLIITMGAPLLPDFYAQFKSVNTRASRVDRKLIPIPDPRPRLVGRDNEKGNQLIMAMQLLTQMRMQAAKAKKRKTPSFYLPRDVWEAAADASGVPKGLIADLVTAWTSDGDNSPAFLQSLGNDRYRLGKEHAKEEYMLIEGGNIDVWQGLRGKASAAKRASRRPRKRKIPPVRVGMLQQDKEE